MMSFAARMSLLALCLAPLGAGAASAADCPATRDELLDALRKSVAASGGPKNGGLENNEWAALSTRDGVTCAVAYSGASAKDQWAGSRAIAVEKANTAVALSLDKLALSTANLYAPTQPAGPLYGLAASSPPDAISIAAGDPRQYGTANDPLIGKKAGGVITFGGGLALYDANGMVGALGVSGDTSCADHNVAWRVRAALGLDKTPAGVGPDHNDEIIYDLAPDRKSASGYGHPKCGGSEPDIAQQIRAGSVPPWSKVIKAQE
jgi:uncharacterized protein GlcG (DUF336 family)